MVARKKKDILVIFGFIIFIVLGITLLLTKNLIVPPNTNYPETLKNKAIFVREMLNTPNSRAGIWEYDFTTKNETQLVSFSEILGKTKEGNKIIDLYTDAVFSPNHNNLIFYLGLNPPSYDTKIPNLYDVWVYDFTNGKRRKILENVEPQDGYLQDPIWIDKNNFLANYAGLDQNKMQLFLVDLSGQKKRLASLVENVIHPTKIGQKVFFTGQTPTNIVDPNDVRLIYYLDLKTGKVGKVNTHWGVYTPAIYASDDTFYKNTGGTMGNRHDVEKEFIYGLEKINLEKNTAERIAIPSQIKLTETDYRVQAYTCGNWAILSTIEPRLGEAIEEGYGKKKYLYNLSDKSIRDFPYTDNNLYLYCEELAKNTLYIVDDQNKPKVVLTKIDLSNPDAKTVWDFSSLIPEEFRKSCLYGEVQHSDQLPFSDQVIYINFRPGINCTNFDPKQGIYSLNLKDNIFTRISTAADRDEFDILLYAPENFNR